MLTGEQPFDGESEEELFVSIKTQMIHLPRSMNKSASALLRYVSVLHRVLHFSTLRIVHFNVLLYFALHGLNSHTDQLDRRQGCPQAC